MKMSNQAPRSMRKPRHVGRITDEILRRRRFVVDVPRVDLGAAVEQEPRDLDRAGAVQRRFSIAAAGLHQ